MSCPLRLIATDDGGVLLDIEGDRLLKLNSTALSFWHRLSAGMSERKIIEEVSREHGMEADEVQRDLSALQQQIDAFGLKPTQCLIANERQLQTSIAELANFPWYAGIREHGRKAGLILTVTAFCGLIAFDFVLARSSMNRLCAAVQRFRVRAIHGSGQNRNIEKICRAVERACVWYPRRALCLQRSAVTTCLLRFSGIPAYLVIGAQPMPFAAHAWVEVGDAVVNDHKNIRRIYRELARY